jgi:hypothetical protein
MKIDLGGVVLAAIVFFAVFMVGGETIIFFVILCIGMGCILMMALLYHGVTGEYVNRIEEHILGVCTGA